LFNREGVVMSMHFVTHQGIFRYFASAGGKSGDAPQLNWQRMVYVVCMVASFFLMFVFL
jgi:hypothetical protein